MIYKFFSYNYKIDWDTDVNKLNTDNLVVAELGDEIRHSYVSWIFFSKVNLLKFKIFKKFTYQSNLSKWVLAKIKKNNKLIFGHYKIISGKI